MNPSNIGKMLCLSVLLASGLSFSTKAADNEFSIAAPLIQQHLEAGTLVEVLPRLATDGQAINLVWQKSRQSLPRISALLEVLAAGLKPSSGNGV